MSAGIICTYVHAKHAGAGTVPVSGTFGSISRPYGVIVTNQYCPYDVNRSIKGSIGAGFFVQNAIRSTTSGERLCFVTCSHSCLNNHCSITKSPTGKAITAWLNIPITAYLI